MNNSMMYSSLELADYRFKIIFTGDSVVGKTSLISSYADNHFQTNTLPTLGVDFKFKDLEIDHKNIQMQIWDTAGQDNFKSITKTYYKGADAVIIVFDVTCRESFDEVMNYADENVEVMILGNKIDIVRGRQVSYEEAKQFADRHQFLYQDVTATEPSIIHEAFVTLMRKILPSRKSIKENQQKLRQKLSLNQQQQKSCFQKFKEKCT